MGSLKLRPSLQGSQRMSPGCPEENSSSDISGIGYTAYHTAAESQFLPSLQTFPGLRRRFAHDYFVHKMFDQDSCQGFRGPPEGAPFTSELVRHECPTRVEMHFRPCGVPTCYKLPKTQEGNKVTIGALKPENTADYQKSCTRQGTGGASLPPCLLNRSRSSH